MTYATDVNHPSVMQWTYIPPHSKNDASEFFHKTLAIKSAHLYNSIFLT